uniref:Uncharacterized protein n=1 Tax=Rhizophora mucronata TaxID=61149 RepID=A0A2P2PBB5_RHIMU
MSRSVLPWNPSRCRIILLFSMIPKSCNTAMTLLMTCIS